MSCLVCLRHSRFLLDCRVVYAYQIKLIFVHHFERSYTLTMESSIPNVYFLNNLIELLYQSSEIEFVYVLEKNKDAIYYNDAREEPRVEKRKIHYMIQVDRGEIESNLERMVEDYVYDPEEYPELKVDRVGLETLVSDMKNLVFPADYTVTLVNTSGFNRDKRGQDKTAIKLDYHDSFQLQKNTLKNFLQGLYRIKSHKFDKWYELFSDVKLEIDGEKNITVSVRFDHGS